MRLAGLLRGTCEELAKAAEGLSKASNPAVNGLDEHSLQGAVSLHAALSSQLPAAHQSALARARDETISC